MTLFRRRRIRTDIAKAASERPLYLGKIRADHYAKALRDPAIRATLARVLAKKKTTRSA